MPTIRESDLPGIGRKVQVETRSGDKFAIVIHDDGKRELYHFDPQDPDETTLVVTMDDDEARQIAAIIGGMTYAPKSLESVEVALDDLAIEWYKIPRDACCIGQSLGELQMRQRTGATIMAIIYSDHSKKVSPGADAVLQADATLVVAGERHQVKALKHLLTRGSS